MLQKRVLLTFLFLITSNFHIQLSLSNGCGVFSCAAMAQGGRRPTDEKSNSAVAPGANPSSSTTATSIKGPTLSQVADIASLIGLVLTGLTFAGVFKLSQMRIFAATVPDLQNGIRQHNSAVAEQLKAFPNTQETLIQSFSGLKAATMSFNRLKLSKDDRVLAKVALAAIEKAKTSNEKQDFTNVLIAMGEIESRLPHLIRERYLGG